MRHQSGPAALAREGEGDSGATLLPPQPLPPHHRLIITTLKQFAAVSCVKAFKGSLPLPVSLSLPPQPKAPLTGGGEGGLRERLVTNLTKIKMSINNTLEKIEK